MTLKANLVAKKITLKANLVAKKITLKANLVQNNNKRNENKSQNYKPTNPNFKKRKALVLFVENQVIMLLSMKFEEDVIETPQLTDSIVLPEDVEFLGQKIDFNPIKVLLTSVQDTASVAKSISSQPPLKFSLSNRIIAESWLLTTCLDHELRISRRDGGSVFVLIKKGSPFLTS
ncbi:hypothetical protein ACH5RR_014743 [Cinchona calisaya]|uniref:Plastid lipid-associated protein/fibrillin conserved domain-containing protein n=1 Tax=Cinchona calisaya TaxID=153742 RepID=A0ABD2ZR58_9GENT